MNTTRFEADSRLELRSEGDRGGHVVGHASVFDQMANVGPHYESIDTRAFDKVLRSKTTDVRALVNHDPRMLLGRQGAGTLELRTDDEGLVFDVELPDTSYANDLRALVARGDMTGASFGFIPGDDKWGRAPDGRQHRHHTSVSGLVDVSIVTFPAYDGAGVALRSIDFGRSGGRSKLIRARARLNIN